MANSKAFQKTEYTIVVVSVIFLLIAAVALWFINGGTDRMGAGAAITFKEKAGAVSEADIEYIKSFDSKRIETVIRSGGNKPLDVEYTGVPLKNLIAGKDIGLDGKSRITVKGADGYWVVISIDELEKKDIYIAYEMNGQALLPAEKNGFGPFQLVIPGDPYSQRWCKFVYEVEVE